MANTVLKKWNGSAWEEVYPETTVTQIVATGTPSSTTFLRGDGVWATPADEIDGGNADTVDNLQASQFLRSDTSDTMAGTLTISGSNNSILMSDGYYINKRFDMLENASPQYILLCASGQNNEVMGTLQINRSSSNYQASILEVVVSARSNAAVQGAALRTLQVLQSGERYDIVTATYDGTQYIAIRYSGHVYPETVARFTGRMVSTGSAALLTTVGSSDVTGVNEFDGDTYSFEDVDNKHFRGNVNIGSSTANPLHKLQVGSFGSTSTLGTMAVSSDANDYAILIEEKNNGAETWGIGVDSDGDLNFYNSGQSTPTVEILDSDNVQINGELHFNDSNTKLLEASSGNSIRIQTDSGYGEVGSKNTGWFHFDTDRPAFYMNKKLAVNGDIYLYGQTSTKLESSTGQIFELGDRVATRDYVDTELSNLVASAPSTLDTLNELAAALGDDANFSTTVTNSIATKMPLAGGTFTGNVRLESGSFASLILDRGTTGSGSVVQFENNNGVIGGIGAYGDDGLQFRTADGTKMVLDSNNNVGISEDSPHERLTVGTINGRSDLAIYRSGNNVSSNTSVGRLTFDTDYNSSPMVVGEIIGRTTEDSAFRGSLDFKVKSTSGVSLTGMTLYGTLSDDPRLGVGTTTPTQKLEVDGNIKASSSGNANIYAERASGANVNMQSQASRGVIGTDSNHELQLKTNATARLTINTSGNITATGDLTLSNSNPVLQLTDSDTSGSAYIDYQGGTSLKVHAGSDPIVFIAGNSEKARITAGNGFLGLGTTNPQASLHIVETSAGNDLAKFRNDGDTADITIKTSGEVGIVKSGAGDQLQLSANGTDNNGIRITTAGYMGVGSTSPSYGLDVHANDGQIRAYGTIAKLWAEASDNGQASLELKNTEGHLRFITDNGAFQLYDQIDAASRFEIDTNGNSKFFGNLTIQSTFPRIYLTDTDDNSDYSIINANGTFSIYDDTNSAYRMRINSSGTISTEKTSYGEPNSEDFYRIRFQDQGGTHNDIGIGQSSSGNLGYNVTAGESHIFYEGTNGEIARLQPSGLALNHSGTGTVDSKAITFTSQFNSTDVSRDLKTNSAGDLLFNGNELATESFVESAAGYWKQIYSGTTTITSGTTATTITTSETLLNQGGQDQTVIAFELNTSSVSSTTSQVHIVKLENSSSSAGGVLFNASASNTSIQVGSIRVYRGLGSTDLVFSYSYKFTNGSSSEIADTVYVGRVWKIVGVSGV